MTTRTLVQALAELVHPDLRHPGLVLEESDAGSTCPPITLNRRGHALVLRPDRLLHVCERPDCHARSAVNARLFPFFVSHKEGLTSLCDYLLFYEPRGNGSPTVFLVELKSGSTGGARRQLQNGKLLAEYLLAMTTLHGEPHQGSRVRFRGVVFTPRARRPRPSLKGPRFDFEQDPRLPELSVARLPADQPWDLDALCAA